MGLFGSDSFLGSLLGGTKGSEIDNVPQGSIDGQFNDIFYANYVFPQLFDYLNAAGMSGEGLNSLAQFTKSGKSMPTSLQDIDFGALSAALPGMKAKAADVQAANFQKTYDTFSKIPALADIFSKAGGNVDSTGALAKIFGDLSGAALGSAASSGFLTDAAKQNNVLGPLALQKYQMEQSIQQNAQAQALGLTGAGGLASQGLFGMNMGGPSPWTGNVLNSAGLFGKPNLGVAFDTASLNTQLGASNSQFNAGILGLSGGSGGGSGQMGELGAAWKGIGALFA